MFLLGLWQGLIVGGIGGLLGAYWLFASRRKKQGKLCPHCDNPMLVVSVVPGNYHSKNSDGSRRITKEEQTELRCPKCGNRIIECEPIK